MRGPLSPSPPWEPRHARPSSLRSRAPRGAAPVSALLAAPALPDRTLDPHGRFRQDWRAGTVEHAPGTDWTLRRELRPDPGGSGAIDLAVTVSGPGPAPLPGPARPELGGVTASALELPAAGEGSVPGARIRTLTWTFTDLDGRPVAPATAGTTLYGLGADGHERIVLSGATVTSVLLCGAAGVEVGINILRVRPAPHPGAEAHVRLSLAVFAGGGLSLRRELLGAPGPGARSGAAGPFAVGDLLLQR